MRASATQPLHPFLREVRQRGVLLESDPILPSVVALIVGRPPRGSWWGDARGHEIHELLGRLGHHRDVATVKLISGKTTFVHRDHWPALVALGLAREPWQIRGLSAPARRLLRLVDQEGEVRCDELPRDVRRIVGRPGDAARELERRLLAHSQQFHTEHGHHAKRLVHWRRWARRVRCRIDPTMTAADAQAHFEELIDALERNQTAKSRLPWR
jgi:hypothetical protein